ncbi:MAG: Uncharacterised protein [Synechococcus sp. MIT S9220]|nr:MAG: Uncharacterised protein [Synechococcus sp. MIT S9220]
MQLVFHVFNGCEFIGDAPACEQQLPTASIHAVISTLPRHALHPGLRLFKGAVQFLHQSDSQFLKLFQSSPGTLARLFIDDSLAQQHTQAGEQGRRHQLAECQCTEAACMEPVLHLTAPMPPCFAPVGEVLAIVEQQVVVLFANPAHGPSQGHPRR